MNTPLIAFERLLNIMDELRAKCPWDQKQTMESLRHLTIEETYELADAVLKKDVNEIKKELGDLLLHIVFYAKIASETNDFNIADVLNSICDKLIHRHPHIYGNVKATTEQEVKKNWEQLKLKEGNDSVLSGVPISLPALIKASRIQEKARGIGFDWEHQTQVWEKVKEELAEFEEEQQLNNFAEMENEFGDLLFSLVNYARFIGINPEDALEKTNQKFIKRFQYMEQKSKQQQQLLHELTLDQLEKLWQEAKRDLSKF